MNRYLLGLLIGGTVLASDLLVIAGIPFTRNDYWGIPKPQWKEIKEALPTIKEMGCDAIFIWAPYEHKMVTKKDTIIIYTKDGSIRRALSSCVIVKDYLKPDSGRGSEEDFLEVIETAHSLGLKVICQLQVTVTFYDGFVYKEHPEWMLYSIYDKPTVNWPWACFPHGYLVNKADTGLISYVVDSIIPYWIENWGIDGIYLDSPGIPYGDLYIDSICKEVGHAEDCEVFSPVEGYYSPESLAIRMREKIKSYGERFFFPAEATVKSWRDCPDTVIIQACHGECGAYQLNTEVDRTLGKYFDWVMDYNFRGLLNYVSMGSEYSYSKKYIEALELSKELDEKYTEVARFVNFWGWFHEYVHLLKPDVADCYITLLATAPGRIMWIGVYQLPPQDTLVGRLGGYDPDTLRYWYKKLIKIKREHPSLQEDSIENALIYPDTAKLIAYNRWYGGEASLVIVNLNEESFNCILRTRFKENSVVYDVVNDTTFIIENPDSLNLSISPKSVRIIIGETAGIEGKGENFGFWVSSNLFEEPIRFYYKIPERGRVSIKVYDKIGRVVKTILDASQDEGYHEIEWDGRDRRGRILSPGVYFYIFKYKNLTLKKKFVKIR